MSSLICSAARTPIGSLGGALSTRSAPELGAVSISAALDRAGIRPDQVDEVLMGNVLAAGIGQAPARQAAIGAGIPENVPSVTLNKVCGSGMKTVMLADQAIRAGDAEILVAGGQESMSNAPYLLDRARFGYRLGDGRLVDSMVHDGLTDAYEDRHMGVAADRCAESCNVPRDAQDEFAIRSYHKAREAIENGWFDREIVPVRIDDNGNEPRTVDTDEEPPRADFGKMRRLNPVFTEEGTVTPGNASTINDGAAALVVASEERAERLGLNPLARILGRAQHAGKPMEFPTAPVPAVERALGDAGLELEEIDLFEVNEAFAVVALIAQDRLGIPADRLNVHGGAVALGHPIGASGARILTTLLYALEQREKRLGLAAICIGGGEATALVVERL